MRTTGRGTCASLLTAALVACVACSFAETAPRFRIVASTYLGGPSWDQAREVIPYPDGSALIGAQVNADGLPVSEGAFQPRYAGDDPSLGHSGIYGGDCYVARLSPDLSAVLAGTYFGGSKQERNTYGLMLDSGGNVVVATMTRSPDIPTTEGCFQPRYGGGQSDIVVAKLSADCRELLWCTYVGGVADESPRGGLALDAEGNAQVLAIGTDDVKEAVKAFLQKRTPTFEGR